MKKIITLLVLLFLLMIYAYAQQRNRSTVKAALERGKKVYVKECLVCHRPNGEGVKGLNPPLYKTSYVTTDDERLIKIVLSGMNQTIEVNGGKYSTAMKAFDFLSDRQIADVLTYIRKSFGNKAAAISPALVKVVREKNL